MSKKDNVIAAVSTKKAPAAIGPYSQAIEAGGFLFVSGQIPVDPKTGEIAGDDIKAQAEQVMKNIGKILKKAGTDYEHAVKTTCFLADLKDFADFNDVYAKYFTGKPARSCVAVNKIPKGVLCEVEVICRLG
jgi:2-iminobutanoate/2-iminopropanoate deaminase